MELSEIIWGIHMRLPATNSRKYVFGLRSRVFGYTFPIGVIFSLLYLVFLLFILKINYDVFIEKQRTVAIKER